MTVSAFVASPIIFSAVQHAACIIRHLFNYLITNKQRTQTTTLHQHTPSMIVHVPLQTTDHNTVKESSSQFM